MVPVPLAPSPAPAAAGDRGSSSSSAQFSWCDLALAAERRRKKGENYGGGTYRKNDFNDVPHALDSSHEGKPCHYRRCLELPRARSFETRFS